METVQLQKPAQVQYVDESQRIFKVWGTVDIVDKQGERLQVHPYFDKIMPIIMKRGGVITFGHTDQQCAKILNYEFSKNETGADGVLLTVQMFDDYQSDHAVWDGIKKGNYPAVSFKGAGVVDQFSSMDAETVVKVLEGYGFAIVDRPANPEAIITEVNYLAKSEMEKCETCEGTGYKKKKEVKSEQNEGRLISHPQQNNNQDITGGISMEETKTEVKQEFVTKEEYSTLSTRMQTLERGQDAILEAIKAMQPAAKKEDEEEPEEEKKKKTEKSVDEKIDAKFQEIVKSLGTQAQTPRPAQPSQQGAEQSKDIMKWFGQFDNLNTAQIATVTKALSDRETTERMKF